MQTLSVGLAKRSYSIHVGAGLLGAELVGGEGDGVLSFGGGNNIKGAVLQVDGTLYFSTPDNAWAVDARDGRVALLFDKPSLRTKSTFTIAVRELGGDVIDPSAEVALGSRETVTETPEMYVTNASLEGGRKITNAQTEIANYAWTSGRMLIDFYHKEPDQITAEELQGYFLHRRNVSRWNASLGGAVRRAPSGGRSRPPSRRRGRSRPPPGRPRRSARR